MPPSDSLPASVWDLSLPCLARPNIHALVMMLGSTVTIAPYAEAYASYILLAAPFMMTSFIMNNILRFQGKALFAMVGITTGGILNIVLDPVFIFGMDMGTAGAALATGISQFVSFCILLAMCNLRRDCISIDIRKFRPTLKLYGQILYGGVASLGRQGIASVATIIMNIMAQPYGDAAIAAMSIVNRFMMFVGSAMIGFGQGFQPVCSYCFGAGMYRRVKEACVFCIKVSTAVLFVFAVIGLIFSGNIVAVFRKDDMDVIRIGTLGPSPAALHAAAHGYHRYGQYDTAVHGIWHLGYSGLYRKTGVVSDPTASVPDTGHRHSWYPDRTAVS